MLGALLGGCKLNDDCLECETGKDAGGGAIAGATRVPRLAAPGSGILAVAYQNQQTGARAHVFLATSNDTGATWTYTEFHVDGGAGEAILPQIVASQLAGKPAAVTAWADFRANQTDGDVYVAVSH
jgi:hypothetical protein